MSELFTIQLINKIISIKNFGGYEDRNDSMIKLFIESFNQTDIQNTKEIYVSTSDTPRLIDNYIVYNFSTINNNYQYVCPDFLFDSWKAVGIESYESKRISIRNTEYKNAKTNKIGWIGSLTGNIRKKIYENYKINPINNLDFRVTYLQKNQSGICTANNFMTLEDQINEWKYLLDIEGNGYSARLKLLLWSNRIIFIADRPYKEFFYQFLIPWTHYIPVKQDLSDLETNYMIIEKDKKLQENIKDNIRIFCERYLTRSAAVKYLSNLLVENHKNVKI